MGADADFTWNKTNNDLTLGTLTVGSSGITDSGGEISFDNENLTTTGDIECNELTLTTATQDWLFTSSWASLSLQAQTSATATRFQLYSKDGDETDDIFYEIYTDGAPGAVANAQWLRMGWNSTYSIFQIQAGKSGTGSDRNLKIQATGNLQLESDSGYVYTNGKLGIGGVSGSNLFGTTTSGSSSTTMYIGNRVITTEVSDERMKINIVDSELDALGFLDILKVVDFDWKSEQTRKGRMTGLIAQQVDKIYPQYVKKPENEEDVGWAVEYSAMVPVLIKAIKELQEKIKVLESN